MDKVWDYKSKPVDNLATQVAKNKDIVMTDPLMAKLLIDKYTLLKKGDVVVDPAKGTGAFYDNLPCFVKKCFFEINEGKDYLTSNQPCDITLSNPPFVPRKLFWQFQQKAMATTKREIYWLINIASLNVFTCNRIEEMNSKKWYINSFVVVQDKRWFGRYVWVRFTHKDKGVFKYNKKMFGNP